MMSLKFLKNFSFFFSILLLLVFTFLFSFTLFISEKPMKINILNLFDRESQILKKKNVREIGNIYITFNKVSKKFEFLIEDILISNFFFPTVMVSLDLSLSKDFFNTSLKLFDGELNDINGVPPVFIKILGKKYEIDRNLQAILGVFVINTYAFILYLI